MPSFRAPVGTHDVMPPESARWAGLVGRFAELAERAGYGLVVSPMFEDVGVFERVGESTDIVRKEMYDFHDKGGRHVALRPEGTASVVRAFVEHRPVTPFKAWYATPSFRYERPQAGRYRQHHQVGVEAMGSDDPGLDVEVIALLDGLHRALGLERRTLHLNSLGDEHCRPRYLQALRAHLEGNQDALSAQSRETLRVNPLRVLDSKRPEDADVIAAAPRLLDLLDDGCAAHFAAVQAGLRRLGIDYVLTPRLVRGLDYYTRTAFEFASDALESAQNAIGGGGRYDRLTEDMGGPPTPGVGFGAGIERMLLACDAEATFAVPAERVDVWIIDTTGGEEALALAHELRAAGVRADRSFDQRSMKAQFKAADRSGARLAVVLGPDEVAQCRATVRLLRGESGQDTIERDAVVAVVKDRLKGQA